MEEKVTKVREQNDRFRKAIPSPCDVPGKVMLTVGVQALCNDDAEPNKHLPALFNAIRGFDIFNEDNDPYKDHSFGSFAFQEETVFWKIDYYDLDLQFGSDEPSDLTQTCRVLTVMLAQEY